MVSLSDSMAGRFLRHEPVVNYPGLKSDNSTIKTGDLFLALRNSKTARRTSVRSTLKKGSTSSKVSTSGRAV